MIWVQVLVSALIVAGVLTFMWRMPDTGERWQAWSAPMALLSVWLCTLSLLLSAGLWVLPWVDVWLALLFLVLEPAGLAMAVLVLWIQRGALSTHEVVAMQKLQAKTAITLGIVAVAVGYIFVMTHKTPFTPVGI